MGISGSTAGSWVSASQSLPPNGTMAPPTPFYLVGALLSSASPRIGLYVAYPPIRSNLLDLSLFVFYSPSALSAKSLLDPGAGVPAVLDFEAAKAWACSEEGGWLEGGL